MKMKLFKYLTKPQKQLIVIFAILNFFIGFVMFNLSVSHGVIQAFIVSALLYVIYSLLTYNDRKQKK